MAIPPEWTILLFEALQKEAEIIARGRQTCEEGGQTQGPPPSPPQSASAAQSRRVRLNLEVEEVGWVRQRLQQGWKENLHQPVIIDVALVQQPHHDTRAAGVSAEPYRELLERWYLHLEPPSPSTLHHEGAGGGLMTAKLKRAQKTIFTRIRTLYSFLRLTPTYQLVRRLQELEDSGGVMGTGGAPSARIHITIKPGLPNSIRWDMEKLCGVESGGEASPFLRYRLPDVVSPYGTLKTTAVYRHTCDIDVGGPPVPRLLGLIDTDQHIIADYVSDTETSPVAAAPPTSQLSSPASAPSTSSGLGQLLRAYNADHPPDQRPYPPPPELGSMRPLSSYRPPPLPNAHLRPPEPPSPHSPYIHGRSHSCDAQLEGHPGSAPYSHGSSVPIPVPLPAHHAPTQGFSASPHPPSSRSSGSSSLSTGGIVSSTSPPTVRYPPPPRSSRWQLPGSSASPTDPMKIPTTHTTPHHRHASEGGHVDSALTRARSLDSATAGSSPLDYHINRLSLLNRLSGVAEEGSSAPPPRPPTHVPYSSSSPSRPHPYDPTKPPTAFQYSRASPSSSSLLAGPPALSSSTGSPSSCSGFPLLGTSPHTSTPTTPKHPSRSASSRPPPAHPSTSTPPFSFLTAKFGEGPIPSPAPFSLGVPHNPTTTASANTAHMLPTNSPPFRTLNNLLSRSPSQPYPPSPPTLHAFSTASTGSLQPGGPFASLGGGSGTTSSHLRGGQCSSESSMQMARPGGPLTRTGSGSSGGSILAGSVAPPSGSASSASLTHSTGGTAQGLDCLGDSPFKVGRGGGDSDSGPFASLTTSTRTTQHRSSLLVGGDLGASPLRGLAPGASREVEDLCLLTTGPPHDDSHDHAGFDTDKEDLPFAVAPRPGTSGSLILGSSAVSSVTLAAASSGLSSTQGGALTGSSRLEKERTPAARLAEQCLSAPPLRIFQQQGQSPGRGSAMGSTRGSLLTRRTDHPSSQHQAASVSASGSAMRPPPCASSSSLLGFNGGSLTGASSSIMGGSAIKSVRALEEDLRDFQRFRQTLSHRAGSTSITPRTPE